ncbi:MAG: outer membrane beta-barrel protein [Bacteroidetes bacterium]|nr:outer membrane beta-barrel protein [Bacteroidota bacterium]
MPKKSLATLLLLCSFFFADAQATKISGTVVESSDGKAVKNAVVALLSTTDTTFIEFSRTTADGDFSLKDVEAGNYIFMVMHPVFADYVEEISINGQNLKMPPIKMIAKSKLLEEVIIKSGAPMRIKGDTTFYTADSFNVSANANVEELLKKLPGIQVDKDGKITAMGENVSKVLVDGEEFFGDDPGMAVKNLRADAVKEVQVFDKKSDQAEFTGIDDGNTQKTINLKLKDNKKRGYFGKIDLAGGLNKRINDRYNNNLMFSTFKGKRKLSAYFLNGNTGQDGLSWEDNEKYGEAMDFSDFDGSGVYFVNYTSNAEETYINPQNGFLTNINSGIQYSNKWGQSKLNISPKFNSQDYYNTQDYFKQTTVGDSSLFETAKSASNIDRYNIKTSATADIQFDSSNSVKISLKGNFYHSESDEFRNSITQGDNSTVKNTSFRKNDINSDKQSLMANILFKHKFKKARRTFTLAADIKSLNSEAINYLESNNEIYFDGLPAYLISQDQRTNTKSNTLTLSATAVYTEPLNKNFSLEISHEVLVNNGNNNQITYTYSPVTGKYDDLLDSLTNDFKQDVITNKPSIKINYSTKKLKYNFGTGFGITDFKLTDKTISKDYVRNFTNFYPSATLVYSYKSNASLRINYNGNTTQPSINQLQPLKNNNDYFYQYLGNPDLKTTFSNNLRIFHNNYNFLKDRYLYQSLNIRLTNNSITNNRIIDLDSGKTTIQPINTNGNLSVSFYAGGGFKVKKYNVRVGFNPFISYNRYAEFINSIKSFSNTVNTGINVYLNKSADKKYDLSLSNNFSYNRNKLTQQTTILNYTTNTLSFEGTVYYKKVWSINTEYDFYARGKTQQFDKGLNSNLWNAKLQRTFAKDEFTAYVKVRDILKDDKGIDRSIYGNTLTEIRNDRLQRYWLVGFIWNFKNK